MEETGYNSSLFSLDDAKAKLLQKAGPSFAGSRSNSAPKYAAHVNSVHPVPTLS